MYHIVKTNQMTKELILHAKEEIHIIQCRVKTLHLVLMRSH